MTRTASLATQQLVALLFSESGLAASIARVIAATGVRLPAIPATHMFERHLAADLADKLGDGHYPALYTFCEKVSNQQTEKFKSFSGTAQLAVELRVSGDRVESLQSTLQYYVDAVTDVLANSRGGWGAGVFYGGGYDVTFQPIKRGGRSYLQTAKISLQVYLSVE